MLAMLTPAINWDHLAAHIGLAREVQRTFRMIAHVKKLRCFKSCCVSTLHNAQIGILYIANDFAYIL